MILVTGSAGYIGSHITKLFDINKISYKGIDNFSYSKIQNVTNKKKFIKCDIKNKKKILKIIKKFNIKTIIHCAAASYVLEGEDFKNKYIANNIKYTKNFINNCKINNVENFIFLSSSNVYKESRLSFSEKSKLKPVNIYGKTKFEIEKFLIKKKFKKLAILRLFNIVGLTKKYYIPNNLPKKYQRLFINLFNKKNEIKLRYIKSKNKKIYPERDFLDINDFLKGIIKVLELFTQRKNIFLVLNFGSGKTLSTKTIVNIFSKKLKFKFNKIENIKTDKEITKTKANINFTKKILNWKPKIKIQDSIKSYIKNLN